MESDRIRVRHTCRAKHADHESFALIKQGTAGLRKAEPCCEGSFCSLDCPPYTSGNPGTPRLLAGTPLRFAPSCGALPAEICAISLLSLLTSSNVWVRQRPGSCSINPAFWGRVLWADRAQLGGPVAQRAQTSRVVLVMRGFRYGTGPSILVESSPTCFRTHRCT